MLMLIRSKSVQTLQSTVIKKERTVSVPKQDHISVLLYMESRIIELENDLHKYKSCHNGSVFSDEKGFTGFIQMLNGKALDFLSIK